MGHSLLQMVLAGLIFVGAYALIVWDKLDRTIVALTGAALMIILSIINQDSALREVDFNTLGLLIGMMIIVLVARRSGVFEYLAIRVVKIAKGQPVRIVILLSLVTGIISAFLNNVTVILLIIPVTLSVAKDLHVNPVPFIISEVFASNVGGTATLIGDPPNTMIGSALGFSFMDFVKIDAPVILFLLFLTTYILVLIYKKKLKASPDNINRVLDMNENSFIKDKSLLIKSLSVLGASFITFLLQGVLHLEAATIALAGAILLLLVSGIRPDRILHEVEWSTIFFFIGLFIMVGGLKEAGIIKLLAQGVIDLTHGNLVFTTMAILWLSAIASAFIDNIPLVATMIPLLKDVGSITGMNLTPVWWAMSLGACLGGNGTIIGASANVVATGIAKEHGHEISFGRYLKVAFPVMLISIVVCSVYIYLIYLV